MPKDAAFFKPNRPPTLTANASKAEPFSPPFARTGETTPVSEFLLEGDNITASESTFPVDLADYPDLRVEDLTVSVPSAAGVFAVSWTTANRGTAAAAGGFRERIVVRNLTTGTTVADHEADVADPLGVGGTLPHLRDYSFTLPGTYEVTVTTDSQNQRFEFTAGGHAAAEQNNTAQTSFPVTLDLQVTAASSSTASAAVRETVSLTYTVTNQGTATAAADWYDRIYLSADTTLDGSDLLLDNVPIAGQTPLTPGADYSLTRSVTIPNGAPLGAQYLLFVADASGQQTESDETNNVRWLEFTVGAPNPVFDGTPTAPASAAVGQSIPVSWTVRNVGTFAALADWTDGVYLSDNATLDTGDALLASVPITTQTPLAPNGTYTIPRSVTIPFDASAGDKFLLFVVDAANAQHETNELDNLAVVAITIGKPDLYVSAATAPATAKVHETIPVSWTVQNLSVTFTAAADWSDGVYLSADNSLDGGDRPLATQPITTQTPLAPNGSYTINRTVTIPNDAVAGNQFLLFVTDRTDQQGESDETNNVRPVAIEVHVSDLTVADVTPGASAATLGGTLDVTWNVNVSGTPLSEPWQDGVYLSADAALDATDRRLAVIPGPGPTPPANSATLTLPLDGSLPPGDYYVIVAADDGQAIFEANENNNWQASSAPVTLSLPPLPDLVSAEITAPPTAAPGATITVGWTVENLGAATAEGPWSESVYLSADGAIGDDFLLATFTYTGSLAPADLPVLRSESVTVPARGWAGALRLVVRVDAAAVLFESDETNNAAIDDAAIQVPLVLTLSAPVSQIREDAANPVIRTVVARTGGLDQPLVVNLASSDTSELAVPASVTIGPGQYETVFEITVQNDGVLDGNQLVHISAAATGADGASVDITVLDAQPAHLTLDIPVDQLAEGGTATATLTREFFTSGALLVTLGSDNLSQLAVPASVTILDGQASATFSVTAVQDMLLELNHSYSVVATAAGFVEGTDRVTVLDDDVPGFTLTLETTVINEGAGPLATIVTLTRNPVSERVVSVNLGSSDQTEAVVPGSVTLPAHVASVRFYVSAVEDLEMDGTQPVTLSATPTETGTGRPITSAAVVQSLQVTDNDGPTLFVDVAANLVPEGLAPATTVTIRRNTGTAGTLVVDLAVSDSAEASIQAQATIADGTDSVTVPVDSLQDGVNDGTKFVRITASAAGFAPGVDTLVVTDVDLPDLVARILSGPAAALTNELVSVSYEVRNAGIFAVAGHYVTRTYLSGDPHPGNDTLVDEFPFSGVMPVDAAFQRSVTVRMPDVVGPAYVIVTVDADSEVQEGVEGNNTAISAAIDVQAAYTATVQTDLSIAPSGTPVPLRGSAKLVGGQPAAYAAVAIDVKVNGTRRRIAALADETGAFAVDFLPLPGEVGDFAIGACHPGVPMAPSQDQFTLFGFHAEPKQLTSALVEQTPKTETVTLRNMSQFALSGLQAQVLDAPANLRVTVSFPQGTNLAGHATVPAEVGLVALDASLLSGTFRVRLTAAEGGLPVDLEVSFRVQPLRSLLASDTAQLVATMVRGEQRVVEFTLRNAGAGASGEIQVLLPDAPWMSLASPAVIPSLAAGQSATVTLILQPAADLPLTLYNGAIACNASDSSLLMPFAFRNVSQAKGDLLVQAVDELYFFDPAQPALAGAVVIVRDAVTGQELTTGTTGADGQLLVTDLHEATYTVEVYANKHDTFRSTVAVAGGRVNTLQAFLSRQTVQYEWTVEQIEIEDRYIVSVEAVFETVVPVPVVTVDPTVIDLYPLQYVGDTMQVDMKIENHGLVQAEDVRINLPTHPVYVMQALIDTIPLLSAKSSVTVPILIQRIAAEPAGPCELWGSVTWSYDAGPYQVYKETRLRFLNVDGVCPVQPSPVVGGGGGGGGGWWGGGGGVPSVTPVYFPPPVAQVAVDLRLRIDQELVMTRSAFEATLDLTNNNTDIPLTEILVGVEIYDEDGNLANDLFQVRPPTLAGLNAVDGTGVLAAEASGSSSWVLVPTDQAAPLEPTVYFVGGTLSYQEGGEAVNIEFTPVQITVQPDAALWLKYFLQRDVYSDDPFTAPVEPAQPFVLGMLLDNRGAGAARNLRITSADPQIVENDHGLLIDFDLIATQVDNQNLTPSFATNFGDVAPGQIRVGQWFMTASLQGQFTEYSASFEHVTGLGDPRVSLIKSVEVHELIHAVRATNPGADGLTDFLTNDLADTADLPDTVHLSDASVRSVGLLTDAAFDGPPVIGDLQVQLTVTPLAEFGYLRADDPGDGLFRLVRVRRSDGSDLPLQNFWQTDRTFGDPQQRPTYEDKLHLFDYGSTGSYTLFYETADVTPPAIISLEQVQPDPRTTAVSTLDVTFSEAINPASFDISDLSLRRDGGGNLIDASVTIVPQSATVFRIVGLAALTGSDGYYDLTVSAAGVTDEVGNVGAGAATESWLKVENVPYIVDIAGVPAALRSQPVWQVVATFSEPVQLASFTAADLVLLHNGAAVPLEGAISIAQTDVASYTVSGLGAATTPDGDYLLTVDASGVRDLAGLSGLGSRSVAWRMDTTGPAVRSTALTTLPGRTVVQMVLVEFTENLLPASFSLADLTLTRNGGGPNLLDPLSVSLVRQTDARYQLTGLDAVAAAEGTYQLALDQSGVSDSLGNAGSGSYTRTWVVDDTPPAPVAALVMTPDNGVSSSDLLTNVLAGTLSGELSESGLGVTLFDTTAQADLGPAAVVGQTFTRGVTFAGSGAHRVRVRATDAAGNSADSFFDVFLDVSLPVVERFENVPAAPATTLDYIDAVFSEPLHEATFTTADLTLRCGGGPNLITAAVTITALGGSTYRIGGLSAVLDSPGQYVLGVLQSGVSDRAGNAGPQQTATAAFAMSPLNAPPENHVPGAQSVNEDQTLTFSTPGGNRIWVSDPDVGDHPVQHHLAVAHGTLTLAGTAGLAFTLGDGTDDAALTFTGTLAAINAALDGLRYTPAADYHGADQLTVETDDQGYTGTGGPLRDTDAVEISVASVPDVTGRFVFYNYSRLDGRNPAANANDDHAIAPDKTALLPGQIATFANYTSYWPGINGIMVDIEGLANPAELGAAQFAFRVGNSNTIGSWNAGPAPSSISVRADTPIAGVSRVTLIWPVGTLQNRWLQVTVLADAVTGLGAPDVFYFGNAIGETGDVADDTLVDGYDVAGVRDHPHDDLINPAPVTDPYDFNRDMAVDATDELVAAFHSTNPDTCLRLLDLREVPLPAVSVTVSPASLAEDDLGQLTYTFTRSGATTAPATIRFRVTGTAVFPDDYTVSGAAGFDAKVGTLTFAPGSATAVVSIDPIADDEVEGDETAWLLVLPGADYAVGSPAHAAGTIVNDDTTTLIVTQFVPTDTGFVARFGRDLEPSVLNVYDSAQHTLGAADVSVTGATVGPVRGSLVVSADQRQITFVQSGGLLEPDTYTVTLFSGAMRFRDTSGGTLDGNADGTVGDDYQTTFTVSPQPAGTVTVSLPDIARGAGQPVNIPLAASGLPIRLDHAAGVTSLAVDLVYDEDLLEITTAALAAGLPADWSVVNPPDTSTPGVAKIRASGTTPLSGTNVDVVRLTAAVPGDAPYGAVQAIRLENVELNGGAIAAIGDVAVHKGVYLGDADGSGIHSSADAFLTVQAALGLASGFAAHPWTDPLIVGDADGSGVLSAADAFLIVQEGLGLSEPFVPDNPHVSIAPVGGGVDPQFRIDVNVPAVAGGWVSVPVKLDIEPAATNVGVFDFDLFFDPARLTIQLPMGVSAGADTAGWAMSAVLLAPGQLRVGMMSVSGQPLAPGLREIAWVQFHVEAGAGSAAFRRLEDDRLKPALRTPVSERPGYVVGLDVEPVDPRAGGYTWTAGDGSVAIVGAVPEDGCAETLRDDGVGDSWAEWSPLEELLSELADDLAVAWR